jgi:hypothetical protein
MNANVLNKLVPLASLFGTICLLAACASSAKDPEGTGATACVGGLAGQPGSGGHAGSGSAGSDGTAGSSSAGSGAAGGAGSGASAGSNCQPGDPITPVIWTRNSGAGAGSGAGGEGGADAQAGPTSAICFSDIVCDTPAVATPGLSFFQSAFAALGSSPGGTPTPREQNASGVPTVTVSYPERGKVCVSGDDGATLALDLTNQAWDGVTKHPETAVFRGRALGITAMSFTLETPPSTGVNLSFLGAGPCNEPVFSDAERGGNRVVVASEETTTLSFATDFGPGFDPNALVLLFLGVGPGNYDYCVTNLKFLDANGTEVIPL